MLAGLIMMIFGNQILGRSGCSSPASKIE